MANGFMEGALQGFSAVNNYYRGQKADERADRELGMRDAMWQNTLDQQQKLDARYTDELQYKRGRDAKDDERQAKIDALNEKSTLASINNAYASNRRADRQLALQEQQAKLLQEQNDRDRYQKDNEGVFRMVFNDLAEKRMPSEESWKIATDSRAGAANPLKYIDGERASAGATFVQSVAPLMKDAQSGKLDWNSKEGIERINSPSIIKSAGVLYQDEIKTGIGGIDPATGKVIKNKELDKIMLTPDGAGVVLGLKVTYDDGSTADHPVTQNRTSDPNDAPRVIPVMDFLGTGYKRAALSKVMQERAGMISQALGYTEGPDNKGYRQEVVQINNQWAKEALRIDRNEKNLSPEQLQAAKDDNDAWRKASIDKVEEVFGAGDKSDKNNDPNNEGQSNLLKWRGKDRLKAAFIEDAAANGRLGVVVNDSDSPEVLDKLFEQWNDFNNNAAAERTASDLRSDKGATSSSQQQRQDERSRFRTPGERDAYRLEQEELARKSGEAYRRSVSSFVPGVSPLEAAISAQSGPELSRMTPEQLLMLRDQLAEEEASRGENSRAGVSSFIPGGVSALEELAKGFIKSQR